jgi:hypothetical protein
MSIIGASDKAIDRLIQEYRPVETAPSPRLRAPPPRHATRCVALASQPDGG